MGPRRFAPANSRADSRRATDPELAQVIRGHELDRVPVGDERTAHCQYQTIQLHTAVVIDISVIAKLESVVIGPPHHRHDDRAWVEQSHRTAGLTVEGRRGHQCLGVGTEVDKERA